MGETMIFLILVCGVIGSGVYAYVADTEAFTIWPFAAALGFVFLMFVVFIGLCLKREHDYQYSIDAEE